MLNRLMVAVSFSDGSDHDKGPDRKIRFADKFKCWSCGLYQTQDELCLSCDKCNTWTLEHMARESGGKIVTLSTARIKPEYEEA